MTRKINSGGNVSFAGASYRAGNPRRRRQVHVAIVGDTVEIAAGGEVLQVHRIKHDPSREHGAFANATGRPSRTNAAGNPPRAVTQLPKPTRHTGTGT